jgi:hypothetical protein
MSRIITYEKCDKCQKEYTDFYVSFGHPMQDFTWKWTCEECGNVNERLIKALPYFSDGIFRYESDNE